MPRWMVPLWLRLPGIVRRWLLWQGNARFIVGVAALCFNERGEILLLDHYHHPDYSWGLPGGWLGRGESPAQAVIRELREETGLEVRDPLLVRAVTHQAWMTLFYRCQVVRQPLRLQASEIRDYCWADPLAPPVRLRPDQQRLIAAVAEEP